MLALCGRISNALISHRTRSMLRSVNFLWTWDFQKKHNKLTVSWKHLLLGIDNVTQTSSHLTVCEFVYCPTNLTLLTLSFPDHPYILAFSLIMLHTDAFNKSNKRKMSKADYVKNTRLPGVAPEVLDVRHFLSLFAFQIDQTCKSFTVLL